MIVSDGLDERINSAIETLKNKCEKANIECGFPGLAVPKKVTDKETTEFSFDAATITVVGSTWRIVICLITTATVTGKLIQRRLTLVFDFYNAVF